jgi:hypothetical protein
MTTQQVANRLVELCSQGKVLEAGQELYSQDIVSIEPDFMPVPRAVGKKAVGEKGAQFAASIEQRHGGSFGAPIVSGRFFSMPITLDATYKGRGRQLLEEIAVYEVKDGKIVFEQFFY